MQLISTALKTHLQGEVTTLSTCWKITRNDGVVLAFTDCDSPLTIGSETYQTSAGMRTTAATSSSDLRVDNMEIEGVLSDAAIAESDILAGRYDHAKLEVFMVNYTDLAAGKLAIKTGWLGEVGMQAGQFVAELRGLSSNLQTTMGEVYTATCRAQFGDEKCTFDRANVTVTGSITALLNGQDITDSARNEADGHFDFGILTMNSGLNAGLTREVKRFENGIFTFHEAWPFALAVGDNYTAIAGCDKRFDTCTARFNNALNFRGEPHVPGTDALLTTAATR